MTKYLAAALCLLCGACDIPPNNPDTWAKAFSACYSTLPQELTRRQRWNSLQNCKSLADEASREDPFTITKTSPAP